jgi:NAD(P)-dependent dehydrogenase (short-subunit alcohol dehydrogenase family)
MHAAIITGTSRGLGEALAAALVERGYFVVGVGRSDSARLASARYRFVACDFAQPAHIGAAVEPAIRELSTRAPESVTLVNSAAVAWPVGCIGRLPDAEAEAALATNVIAPLALCNAFLRVFADDAMPRRIINISSGAAQLAIAGSAVYSMSKAAVEMLTRAIAAECTAPNFRCITLRPGIFDTDMQAYMRSRDPAEFPDVALFRGFKDSGLLKEPADVAARIADRLIAADVEHGRTYTHQDF